MDNKQAVLLKINKEDVEKLLKKLSGITSTQPTYVDESGKRFTPADIVRGYKPKGKYKGSSASRESFITSKSPKIRRS